MITPTHIRIKLPSLLNTTSIISSTKNYHHGFDDCEGFGWLPDFWLPYPLQYHLHGHDHDHQDQNHFIIMNAYISWIVKSLVDSLTSCHPLPLIRVLWVVFGEASTCRLEIKFKTCNFYFHQKKTGILAICILVELKHRKSFEKKKNYRKPVEHGFTSAGGQEQTHVSVFQSRPWEISQIRLWKFYFSTREKNPTLEYLLLK